MRRAILVSILLSGCNQIFGLERTSLGTDSGGEVGVDADAEVDAGPCPRGVVDGTLDADAMIIANSSQTFGALATINIGTGINSVGMFRFDIAALPAGKTIDKLVLAMPYATSSTSCAPSCGSCSFDTAGQLTAYFMRSNWGEGAVNWTQSGAGAWSSAGASGPLDRSAAVVIASHIDDAATTVELPAVALGPWLLGTKLSIQIVPGAGTVMVVTAREKASLEPSCPPVAPASLRIEYCL